MDQEAMAAESRHDANTSSPVHARLLLAGLLVFCFLCSFFHVSDVDVGYHIRTGEHILDGHGIPGKNTFSFSVPEDKWLIQQWMPATIYAGVHRLGGITALTTFKALLAVVAMFLVWCCARDASRKVSLWPFWICTLAVLILRVRFFERPDLFSTTLFALVLFLDQRFGDSRRWQWLFVPLIMAFWANTHGGYIYGFVLLTTLAAAEWLEWLVARWRKVAEPTRSVQSLFTRPLSIALSLIIAVASVQLINPSGWKTLLVPFMQFFSKLWRSIVVEFQPPTWGDSKLLFIWAGVLVVLQIITRRHFRMRYFVASTVFGYFAFSSQRSLPAFVIVSVPHLAYMLGKLPKLDIVWFRSKWRQPLLPLAWAALIALVILPDKVFLFGTGFYHPYYPTEIFGFIKREVPPQNVFNDMRLGGPMLWALYPNHKPFIDGRNDAFTEEFWRTEYLPAIEGTDGWKDIFEKYRVTAALLSLPTPTKVGRLAQKLFEQPDWALVAFNDETVLFLKRTEANQSIIQRHSFTHLWPGNWNLGEINETNVSVMAAEAALAWDTYPGLYAHSVTARCAMLTRDYARASELLNFLTKQPDASEPFWRDYAYSLFMAKRFDEADRVLDEMLRRKMSAGFAYYLKHFVALQQQQPGEAKVYLGKALEAEPANGQYRQALMRLQSGDATTNRQI
jgi:pentatricopeptide repeat protein